MNKIILLGRLGKDPEFKKVNSGTELVTFSLATSRKYKDRNGDKQEDTQWHEVVFYGNSAKVIADYVRKGDQLMIEGEMRYRTYENQEGQKVTRAGVVGNSFEFISSPKREDKQAAAKPTTNGADDDLPF